MTRAVGRARHERPVVGLLITIAWMLSGCASLAEGVTKGLIESEREALDPRACDVVGPAFDGLRSLLAGDGGGGKGDQRKTLKVLMVHGIGDIAPGYSTRLQRNLAQALFLRRTASRVKELKLRSVDIRDEALGQLNVARYLDAVGRRELIFYELTWSEITRPVKEALLYDTSGAYAFRRATINQAIKEFLNARVPDPAIYTGHAQGKILEAVSQAACWMLHKDWDELPDQATGPCESRAQAGFFDLAAGRLKGDDFVFITHSLGSRIVVDALQREVEQATHALQSMPPGAARGRLESLLAAMRERRLRLYMLANQLPLLELGREPPEVVGQTDAYCRVVGRKQGERLFRELFIVAFNDPNDLLSYAIPPRYAEQHMDSRLCPTIVNVTIHIARPVNVLGFGDFADPVAAHTEYEDDPRVIGLIVNGIGQELSDPAVSKGCTWLETVGG